MKKIALLMVVLTFILNPVSGAINVNVGNDGQIDTGLITKVNITMSDVPNGLAGYNITVSLSNKSVAEIISVDFPAWAAIHSNGSLPDDSVWLKAADPLKIV